MAPRTAKAVQAEPVVTLPSIGAAWPGVDGIYAGISRGEDGQPDGHLILLNVRPANDMNWADAVKWAQGLSNGARLPTRFESALIYANLRDNVDTSRWHWTGTQYSSSDAWFQYFDNGGQSSYDKKFEARCRAVRRLPLQSFNSSMELGPQDGTVQALLQELVSEVKSARADVQKIFLADVGAA